MKLRQAEVARKLLNAKNELHKEDTAPRTHAQEMGRCQLLNVIAGKALKELGKPKYTEMTKLSQ